MNEETYLWAKEYVEEYEEQRKEERNERRMKLMIKVLEKWMEYNPIFEIKRDGIDVIFKQGFPQEGFEEEFINKYMDQGKTSPIQYREWGPFNILYRFYV